MPNTVPMAYPAALESAATDLGPAAARSAGVAAAPELAEVVGLAAAALTALARVAAAAGEPA